MKVQFNIHYHSIPGQNICIILMDPKTGKTDASEIHSMNYSGEGFWNLTIEINKSRKKLIYKYVLTEQDKTIKEEWGKPRSIELAGFSDGLLYLRDFWRTPKQEEKILYSSAFSKVLMKNATAFHSNENTTGNIIQFQLNAPRAGTNLQLCIVGNHDALGNWDKRKPLLMGKATNTNCWRANIPLKDQSEIQYKYGIYDTQKQIIITLEKGENRVFQIPKTDQPIFSLQLTDESFRYPNGSWRAAGVSVPVFSLRTSKGFGIGEFSDLMPFIDWADSVCLKMIQILPVNETIASHDWHDAYPYKSISVMALHPIYMNLEKMGKIKDKKVMLEFKAQREKLNRSESIDYPEVLRLKSRYYKLLFDQEKEKTFKTKAYQAFFKANSSWLVPYAAFAYLRDKMKNPDFRTWNEYEVYDTEKIQKLCDPSGANYEHIAVHYFIQYHLDKQLYEVTKYARKQGVVLKGDIPIGISPNSVEAWIEPHLFNLNTQTGAPPDDFAIKGQNWGFPTYNWEHMAEDGYNWWRIRLQKMGRYFDAYRIDHILGFFRIWEIPTHAVDGLLGYFNPCLPLTSEDIEKTGIHFNYNRLSKPYIRQHIIENIFGDLADMIIEKFLDQDSQGIYELKSEFNTQKKVNNYFLNGILEKNLLANIKRIRDGLFTLISNVIFIQLGKDAWHPRVNLQQTSSFSDLDVHTQDQLKRLYNHFYYRKHDHFWFEKAMEKLPSIIAASDMLVCGEDLGMVPDCVNPAMKLLNILSLEIQRMPKNPKVRFGHPADAPYLSVCTSSTHDMPTIRGWWEEDRERTQIYYNQELSNIGIAPYFAEPWVCKQIIDQHFHSPAMWVTIPIQDLIAIDGVLRWEKTHEEQINEPSNVSHKWKFRMVQDLKELMNADSLNEQIRSMIKKTGRNSDY